MRQPIQIIVVNYEGREVNPYPNPKATGWAEGAIGHQYHKFEQLVKSYPCPSIANTEPGKTILARLADAVDKGDGKIEVYDVKPLFGIRELGWKDIKVWVPVSVPIVEQKEGEGKPLPPAIQRLADAIEASGNKITFGLQPDQIALIESTLQEGFTTEYAFEKVAEQINWDKYTLVCWYVKHLRKQLPSPPITEK